MTIDLSMKFSELIAIAISVPSLVIGLKNLIHIKRSYRWNNYLKVLGWLDENCINNVIHLIATDGDRIHHLNGHVYYKRDDAEYSKMGCRENSEDDITKHLDQYLFSLDTIFMLLKHKQVIPDALECILPDLMKLKENSAIKEYRLLLESDKHFPHLECYFKYGLH